jgi:hypothetical protein
MVIGAGVKTLAGEGRGLIPVAYGFFYLAVIFCMAQVSLLARAALWKEAAWIEAEDRRTGAAQSI